MVLKLRAGLIPRQSGELRVFGSPARAGQREVGLMFQPPVLLSWRTVRENVVLPFEIFRQPVDEKIVHWASRSSAGRRSFSIWWDCPDSRRNISGSFPGGMRQRAALARLLITDPSLLLLDKPLAALDELTRERLTRRVASILWCK